MIRLATYADINAIVRMSREFWDTTIYEEPFDIDSVSDMASFCIDQGLCCVLDVGGYVVGFACGLKSGLLANNSVTTGTEVAWWVDPDHRGRNGLALLKYLEKLAKQEGIKYWNMVYMQSSMPEEVKSIYEKLGYKRNEVIYTRVL